MSKPAAIFIGEDTDGKTGLWVTDGTTAGSTELASGLRFRDNLTTLGNQVLFTADDPVTLGFEHLWITDGTIAGTSELNVAAAARNFFATDITVVGDKALFFAEDGQSLWITDGTAPGTSEVASVHFQLPNLTALGTKAIFTAGSATLAPNLWVTDGTAAGTSDITPASASTGLGASDITVVGTKAFFIGDNAFWVTDGTAAGTSELGAPTPGLGSTPQLTALDGKLLYEGLDAGGQLNLFVSDGTSAGTSELIIPGTGGSLLPSNITVLGSKALFTGAPISGGGGLWVTDGTVAGTSELNIPGEKSTGPIDQLSPSNLTVFGTKVLFAGFDSHGKEGLWSTDGTAAGTTEIFAPPPTSAGLNPHGFTVAGDEAFFLSVGASGGLSGNQEGVWVTDGTIAGTSEVTVPNASTGALGLNAEQITAFTVLCFHRGTRIATPTGETPVQGLREGDIILTASGEERPIIWVGRRKIDCRTHPDPAKVWPIRIKAGAFAPGLPQRDLLVSPQHAIYDEGVLIPARYLVNGTSVVIEPAAVVEYYHIELSSHDLLLAEGLPCESYLDTGNRGNFDNGGGAMRLHPDFAAWSWDARACAELKVVGPEVEAVKAKLAQRASLLASKQMVRGSPAAA